MTMPDYKALAAELGPSLFARYVHQACEVDALAGLACVIWHGKRFVWVSACGENEWKFEGVKPIGGMR